MLRLRKGAAWLSGMETSYRQLLKASYARHHTMTLAWIPSALLACFPWDATPEATIHWKHRSILEPADNMGCEVDEGTHLHTSRRNWHTHLTRHTRVMHCPR